MEKNNLEYFETILRQQSGLKSCFGQFYIENKMIQCLFCNMVKLQN